MTSARQEPASLGVPGSERVASSSRPVQVALLRCQTGSAVFRDRCCDRVPDSVEGFGRETGARRQPVRRTSARQRVVADQIKVIGAGDVQYSTVQLAQRRHDAVADLGRCLEAELPIELPL